MPGWGLGVVVRWEFPHSVTAGGISQKNAATPATSWHRQHGVQAGMVREVPVRLQCVLEVSSKSCVINPNPASQAHRHRVGAPVAEHLTGAA